MTQCDRILRHLESGGLHPKSTPAGYLVQREVLQQGEGSNRMIQKYIIYGKPITKKNSPRIGYVGAHCPVCHKGKYAKVLPSAAYLKYARTAKIFLKPAPKNPLDGRYNVKCLYYMPTRHRVDKTNLESAIMDILVDARILKDDNSNIVAATDGSRVLYDKANPRTEIFIDEVEEVKP